MGVYQVCVECGWTEPDGEAWVGVPAVKAIAESDAYLKQPNFNINQKVFTDAMAYAI